jgi:hypothetical protein
MRGKMTRKSRRTGGASASKAAPRPALRLAKAGRRCGRHTGWVAAPSAMLLLVSSRYWSAGTVAQAASRMSSHEAATTATTVPPPPVSMSNCPNGMSMISDSYFQVFACADGPPAATDEQSALNYLETHYGPETALMGPPIKDYAIPGENGLIDVYLVSSGQLLTREGVTTDLAALGASAATHDDAINGTVSSGYIVATRPEALPGPDDFESILVHEFFHVLSDASNTTASCSKFWFTEASATWAEWYFVPQKADTQVYPFFTDDFQPNPNVSLTDSTSTIRPDAAYAGWIWPLFMQQTSGATSIASAWFAMVGRQGCNALDGAINQQVGFKQDFKKFAVENFDYELPNLQTLLPAWPTNFGNDYPSYAASANPTALAFPEQRPSYDAAIFNNPYPYTATELVDLPSLSAQYTYVAPNSPSLEFDFSGLSNATAVDINVLGAEVEPKGHVSHNGVWKRVKLAPSDTKAKICLNADGTKGASAITGNLYVILDNHSWGSSAQTVTGSYTVTARTTCAASLSGNLTLSSTQTQSASGTTLSQVSQAANIGVNLSSSTTGWTIQPASTWNESFTYTSGCTTLSASGNGTLQSGDFNLAAYSTPYANPPLLTKGLLSTESAQGTWSGCFSGTEPVSMMIGTGCPGSQFNKYFQGSYASGKAGVDLTCADTVIQHPSSGVTYTYTNNLAGILTAVDPLICALWTANCSIGS